MNLARLNFLKSFALENHSLSSSKNSSQLGQFTRPVWEFDRTQTQPVYCIIKRFVNNNYPFLSMSTQEKETSSRLVRPTGSTTPRRKPFNSKKYSTIRYETRKELIRRVVKQNERLIPVAKQLGIKLSTSKFIIKSYKKWGRIFKKRSIGEDSNNSTQEILQTETQPQQPETAQPQIVFYPYYIYVPHPLEIPFSQWYDFPNTYWGLTVESNGNFLPACD